MQFSCMLDEIGKINSSFGEYFFEIFSFFLDSETQFSEKIQFIKGYFELMLFNYWSKKISQIS